MKFKTLFLSDAEKHSHHYDLPLFLKQFLAPGGLRAECVQISVMQTWLGGLKGLKSSKCYKLDVGYITVVIGTNVIFE